MLSQDTLYFVGSSSFSSTSSTTLVPGFSDKPLPDQPSIPPHSAPSDTLRGARVSHGDRL